MGDACYAVTAIGPGLWAVAEGNVRMFLLEGDEFALLIDTGVGGGDLRTMAESLTEKPLRVLNTHKHFDHIACNRQFAFFYIHPEDAEAIRPQCPENAELRFLRDGDALRVGDRSLEVVHTPGHSAGCICLLDRGNRVLYGGDNVGDRPVFTIFPDQSLEEYAKSLERLISLEGAYDKIFASHGSLEMTSGMARELLACCRGIQNGGIAPEPTVIYDGSTQNVYRLGNAAILYL